MTAKILPGYGVVKYTEWHEIFAGSNFCDFCGFSSDLQK